MIEFLLAFILIFLLVMGMAVGVLRGGKPISGSCGGLANLGLDGACEICGGKPEQCRADAPDPLDQVVRSWPGDESQSMEEPMEEPREESGEEPRKEPRDGS